MTLQLLPFEILHIIFDLCNTEGKYILSQTCKYFKNLKIKKPKRYYCFWQNCEKIKTKYGKYGAKYVFFFSYRRMFKIL